MKLASMTSEANFILFLYPFVFISLCFYIPLFLYPFWFALPFKQSEDREIYQSFDTACRRAMYLPRMSNSMLTTVPTSMLQKLVWS